VTHVGSVRIAAEFLETVMRPSSGGQSDTWPISEHPKGTVVSIKAQPGSKKNEVRLEENGQIKVCVTQRPEKGKANRAVLEVLAEFLGVRESQVELISGETSQKKRVLIHGLSAKEVNEKLNRSLSERNQD